MLKIICKYKKAQLKKWTETKRYFKLKQFLGSNKLNYVMTYKVYGLT